MRFCFNTISNSVISILDPLIAFSYKPIICCFNVANCVASKSLKSNPTIVIVISTLLDSELSTISLKAKSLVSTPDISRSDITCLTNSSSTTSNGVYDSSSRMTVGSIPKKPKALLIWYVLISSGTPGGLLVSNTLNEQAGESVPSTIVLLSTSELLNPFMYNTSWKSPVPCKPLLGSEKAINIFSELVK